MNSFLLFFVKYKKQINFVLLVFWLFIIYDAITNKGFTFQKIIIPILFVVLSLFNIYKASNPNKTKSEN
jgi:hypothetical protein